MSQSQSDGMPLSPRRAAPRRIELGPTYGDETDRDLRRHYTAAVLRVAGVDYVLCLDNVNVADQQCRR